MAEDNDNVQFPVHADEAVLEVVAVVPAVPAPPLPDQPPPAAAIIQTPPRPLEDELEV